MIETSSTASFGGVTLIFSILLYVALELFISKQNHYHSGLDDALLWMSMGFIIAAANLLLARIPPLGQSVLVCILALYSTLRFANSFMSGIGFLSLLAIVFYMVLPFGNVGKATMPFLMMIVSLITYLLLVKNKKSEKTTYYHSCFVITEVISLITLYCSVNYFVVREVSNAMFDLRLAEGQTIPGGWLFWLITCVVPPVYLIRGIMKKDAVELRVGLLLMAATFFTIHHYYPVAPVEISMTVAGIIMIVAAYFVTKYLESPKYGITSKESNDPGLPGMLQLEALIIAQTFHQSPADSSGPHVEFGGGSGGGGGATGQY